jgi:hypothetical protein
VEVEARIRKVLDSTTTPSPGTVPDHLRRGVTSVRVSTFVILSFHCPCDLAQGLGCGGSEPWGADPPMDASRWEARHASNGVTWVCEERERESERDWRTANQAARKQGTKVPTGSASSSEGEIEWGWLCLHVSALCGLFSASRHDSLVDRALGRRTSIETPLS